MSSNGFEFTIQAMQETTCEFHGFASYREALSVWKVVLKQAHRAPENLTVDLYDFEGRLVFSSSGPVDGDEPLANLRSPGLYAVEWFGPQDSPDYRLVPIQEGQAGLGGAGGGDPQSKPSSAGHKAH